MNKRELVDAVSKDTGITKKDVEGVLNSITANITKAVSKKDSVSLVGFGTFSSTKRAARTGKNPQTGEKIKIPAATVPKFKAGKAFKDAVNKSKKK